MSIVIINAVTVPADKTEEFEQRFAARAGKVSSAPGFEAFELLRPQSGDRYLVYTRWRSDEDFQAWMSSRSFAESHAQRPGAAPAAPAAPAASDVWSFDVLQGEYV